jgi:hypothetical protein
MDGEMRAIVIDALSDEIIRNLSLRHDKASLHFIIGLMEMRHRLMVEQLTDQAAETHRLNGIINHPPRDLTPEMAREMP